MVIREDSGMGQQLPYLLCPPALESQSPPPDSPFFLSKAVLSAGVLQKMIDPLNILTLIH